MKEDFPDNPVNEDREKEADITPEDMRTSFEAHSHMQKDEDNDPASARKRKAEWQETTDNPEDTAEDTVTDILTNEPEFPEESDTTLLPSLPDGDKPESNPPDNPQKPEDFVSNRITIQRKKGQPPTDKVLNKALEQAVEQGWKKIYVFGKNNRTPDIETAQYIQSFIEKNNLSSKLCCCCNPDEYKSAGTARKIHKNNLRSGATRGKNMEFK